MHRRDHLANFLNIAIKIMNGGRDEIHQIQPPTDDCRNTLPLASQAFILSSITVRKTNGVIFAKLGRFDIVHGKHR